MIKNWCAALAASACLLAGCGGGGREGATASPLTTSAGDELRRLSPTLVTQDHSSTDPVVNVSQAVNRSASDWVVSGLTSGTDNVMAITPMAQAYLGTLIRAARGDTLAEIDAQIAARSLDGLASALLPAGVSRDVLGKQGSLFRQDFLNSIQRVSPATRVSYWSAFEVDDAGYLPDRTMRSSALDSWYAMASQGRDIRLLQEDRFGLSVDMPGGIPLPALYSMEDGSSSLVNTQTWTDGAKEVAAPGFTAEVLQAGDYFVMTVSPTAGKLADWTADRLSQSIAETQTKVASGHATSGRLTLIPGQHAVTLDPSRLLPNAKLAFNPIQADLRGLDLQGGTYLVSLPASAQLSISMVGLSISSTMTLGYVYEKGNVHQSPVPLGSGFLGPIHSSISFDSRSPPPPCPSDMEQLRSTFLVVLDSQGQVVLLTALRSPHIDPADIPLCTMVRP